MFAKCGNLFYICQSSSEHKLPSSQLQQEMAKSKAQIAELQQKLSVGSEVKVWSAQHGYALTAVVQKKSDSDVQLKFTDCSYQTCAWADVLTRLSIPTVL